MQTITLKLTDPLYRVARQVAEVTGQPLEVVLQNSIAQALPPLADIPAEEVTDLAAMTALDDAALWREARQEMAAEEQAELQDLLDSQSAGQLSTDDAIRLEALLDTYGRLMVHKAHAWLLLARHGYQVPVQQMQD